MSKLEDKIDPAIGQIYKVERNEDYYQILYVDEQIVLLRSSDPGRNGGNVHRIERRVSFDSQVDSGWFKYQPDSELDMVEFTEVDWSQVSQIGAKTSENLHKNDYKTNLDIQQAEDNELLNVSGLGAKGLDNLRRFAR